MPNFQKLKITNLSMLNGHFYTGADLWGLAGGWKCILNCWISSIWVFLVIREFHKLFNYKQTLICRNDGTDYNNFSTYEIYFTFFILQRTFEKKLTRITVLVQENSWKPCTITPPRPRWYRTSEHQLI